MDFFTLLLIFIILILLYKVRDSQKRIVIENKDDIDFLKKQLNDIKKSLESVKEKDNAVPPAKEDNYKWRPQEKPVAEKEIFPSVFVAPEIPIDENIVGAPHLPKEIKASQKSAPTNYVPSAPTESWWQRWLRNNPDLEKFIGENLVNKIGIAVLVLGIAFFVKYAIDQEWINEVGRVCIGLACGMIMTGIAHYLRNNYKSFSSVLAGGGIAVFYFTIAFAYHQYQLFGQTAAFVIMVGITVFAVALSLLYNKIELAVIALIGGFLAPFLVSSGSGNYVTLFSYLLLLSTGILIIAFFKKWPLLITLSFIFSWIIFDAWLIKDYAWGGKELPHQNAILFATAFYLLFLITVMINNLRTQKPFKAFDFSLLLVVTFSYYFQGMFILSEWNDGSYQGLFTMLLGFVNLCLAWYLFRTQKGDKNLLYLLIGLTLTFISLVAPVQLHGHSITLFWSAEAVLLYWLHQRSGIKIFKLSSILVLLCMGISLLIDWSLANDRADSYLPLIFTNWQGIVTNVVATLSLAGYAWLLFKDDDKNIYFLGIRSPIFLKIFAAGAFVLFYITCIFAVNLYFREQQSFTLPNNYHQLITYLLAIAAIHFALGKNKSAAKNLTQIITAGCLVFYFCSAGLANSLLVGIKDNSYTSTHALAHWLSVATLVYLLYRFVVIIRQHKLAGPKILRPLCIAALALLSIECRLIYLSIFATNDTIQMYNANYAKAGLTIIWASFSFTLIWLGLRTKNKSLRIIALSIFSIALLKLFLFDIRNISEGGKIAAFIMLGALLLVISFMYQRLKKIIIDNEEKKD